MLTGNMGMIVTGVLTLVVGIALADPVITILVEALAKKHLESFSEASAIGGLIPLVYFMVIIGVALSLMGAGGYRSLRGGR